MSYMVEGYLTENKLLDIFKSNIEISEVTPQYKIPNTKYSCDYFIIYNNIPIIVEFEGEPHFRDIDVIRRDDIKKDLILYDRKFEYVTIPYFIQLTDESWKWFFHGLEFDIKTNFKHGFIDKKAKLPSSFCAAGYYKFQRQLEFIYDSAPSIFFEIYNSLIDWEIKVGGNYVYVDTFFQVKLEEYISESSFDNNLDLIKTIINKVTHLSTDEKYEFLSVI